MEEILWPTFQTLLVRKCNFQHFLLGIMVDVERKTRKHPFYSTWFPATALHKKALSLSTEFFGTMLYIEGNKEVILIIVKLC